MKNMHERKTGNGMKRKSSLLLGASLLFLLDALAPKTAYAYLDPASGSYIIQIVIAVFVGGAFVIKQYFGAIRSFFKGRFAKGNSDAGEQQDR